MEGGEPTASLKEVFGKEGSLQQSGVGGGYFRAAFATTPYLQVIMEFFSCPTTCPTSAPAVCAQRQLVQTGLQDSAVGASESGLAPLLPCTLLLKNVKAGVTGSIKGLRRYC